MSTTTRRRTGLAALTVALFLILGALAVRTLNPNTATTLLLLGLGGGLAGIAGAVAYPRPTRPAPARQQPVQRAAAPTGEHAQLALTRCR